MFGVRLRSGIILVALALLTIISGGYVLFGTLLAISLIGLGELYRAAKIRKKEEGYYLTDMNSRNGTMVNGRLLLPDEEYRLQNEDEVDFAQARYVFLE